MRLILGNDTLCRCQHFKMSNPFKTEICKQTIPVVTRFFNFILNLNLGFISFLLKKTMTLFISLFKYFFSF